MVYCSIFLTLSPFSSWEKEGGHFPVLVIFGELFVCTLELEQHSMLVSNFPLRNLQSESFQLSDLAPGEESERHWERLAVPQFLGAAMQTT